MFFQDNFFKKGFLRKFFVGFAVAVLIGLFADAAFVFADEDGFTYEQGTTVLPYREGATYAQCEEEFKNKSEADIKKLLQDPDEFRDYALACAIITGRVHMYMIPYFIVYLIDVLVKLAATLCVLFIVIGGFQYAIGGISDEKEKAKKTILNAIYGLIITSMAWIVINVIQVAITSGGQ